MAVEYDLVIIGDTPTGRTAAALAVATGARVALVQQGETDYHQRPIRRCSLTHFVGLINKFHRQLDYTVGINQIGASQTWAEAVIDQDRIQNSLVPLAAAGVDYIAAVGEFIPSPELALMVENRRLRSSHYLLATSISSALPPIEGIETSGCLDFDSVWQPQKLQYLPQQIAIVGGRPESLELASSLAQLDKEIILIVDTPRLLPTEDTEAVGLLQADLEAHGVKIITDAPVCQVKQIDTKTWLQAGNRAIEAEAVIFADYWRANFTDLNLTDVAVKHDWAKVEVNQWLQTTNPRIWAVGEILGGYCDEAIGAYEAMIAVKNTLLWRRWQVNYSTIPWGLNTRLPFAKVGMTQAQAQNRYPQAEVVRRYHQQLITPLIEDMASGMVKIVVDPKGKILGAQIVGYEAREMIGAIAMAMSHGISLKSTIWQGWFKTCFPHVSTAVSEILQQAALELQQRQIRQNWMRTWLRWRR